MIAPQPPSDPESFIAAYWPHAYFSEVHETQRALVVAAWGAAVQAERLRIVASLREKAVNHVGVTGDVDRVYLRLANQLESGTL